MFVMRLFLLFLSVIVVVKQVCALAANEEIVTVSLKNGTQIRGLLRQTLFKDRTYAAFRGVPFAEPPIGKLRFKVINFS